MSGGWGLVVVVGGQSWVWLATCVGWGVGYWLEARRGILARCFVFGLSRSVLLLLLASCIVLGFGLSRSVLLLRLHLPVVGPPEFGGGGDHLGREAACLLHQRCAGGFGGGVVGRKVEEGYCLMGNGVRGQV